MTNYVGGNQGYVKAWLIIVVIFQHNSIAISHTYRDNNNQFCYHLIPRQVRLGMRMHVHAHAVEL